MGGNSMQDRNRHTMSASSIDRHSNHFEGPSNSTRGSDLHGGGGDARSVLSMDSMRNSRDNNGGGRERFSPHYHSGPGGNGSGPAGGGGGGGGGNQSSSPPYCPVDGIGGNGGIKSDSPSRKRRRVSSRLPSQSPPAAIWEHRRSPRNGGGGGGMMSLMGTGGGGSLWTYSAGPHISICSGHPAAPHLPPCQVHGVYSQPFAQTCGIGGHFGSFASSAGPALAVPHPPPHQAHYQHPHLAQQAHPQPLGHPQPAHVTLSATTSAYSGILLNFLAMFPLSTYGPPDLNSPDSNETENYEALLSLAERLGEAKPRGLARPEIDQLPSYKFNAETHTGDQTSCVVCMCDFEARQILRVLPCSHEFHAKCVDKWLRSNRTCPICRGNASEYFESSEEQ
uniref:RING-type domain-containing protein n=1 Tax=Anopheles maculatus TaxID=74869 RepID=A0A182SMI9_9DIPT